LFAGSVGVRACGSLRVRVTVASGTYGYSELTRALIKLASLQLEELGVVGSCEGKEKRGEGDLMRSWLARTQRRW
jgi:hypothetical protein